MKLLKLVCALLFISITSSTLAQVPYSIYVFNSDGSEDTTGRYKFLIVQSVKPELICVPVKEYPGIEQAAHSFQPKKKVINQSILDSLQILNPSILFMSQPPQIYGAGLAVVDTITSDTMMIFSGIHIGGVRFTPGKYVITSGFSKLFGLMHDTSMKIINKDIRYFDVSIPDSTRYLRYREEPLKVRNLNLFPIGEHGLIASSKGDFYKTFDGVTWDTFANERWNSRVSAYHAVSLDKDYYYIVNVNRSREIQNIKLFKEGSHSPDTILFPDTMLIQYAYMTSPTEAYAIACTRFNRTDYILYKSTNQGKTWEVLEGKMSHTYRDGYTAELIYIKNKLVFITDYETREVVFRDIKNGLILSDKEVTFNPESDTATTIGRYTYYQKVAIKRNEVCYLTNHHYKGVQAKLINFNEDDAVIADNKYILLSHDGGQTWKYYPTHVRRSSTTNRYELLPNNKLVIADRYGMVVIDLSEY